MNLKSFIIPTDNKLQQCDILNCKIHAYCYISPRKYKPKKWLCREHAEEYIAYVLQMNKICTRTKTSPIPQREIEALEVLGMNAQALHADIKTTYRKLIKKYHPDFNNGIRLFEHKLQQVTQAYQILMSRTAA